MRTYVSCNCLHCRYSRSKVKEFHKRQAHRELRREAKKAIRNRDEDNEVVVPQSISTGYVA